eukprot:1223481-Amphidinium_carterae.1
MQQHLLATSSLFKVNAVGARHFADLAREAWGKRHDHCGADDDDSWGNWQASHNVRCSVAEEHPKNK